MTQSKNSGESTCKKLVDLANNLPNYEIVKDTSIFKMPTLSKNLKNSIWLKCENEQTIGSFKIRGVTHFIDFSIKANASKKFVCGAKFNHSLAAAEACKFFDAELTVVLPRTMKKHFTDMLAAYKNVSLLLFGNNYVESHNYALQIAKDRGDVLIPNSLNEHILAGNAGIAKEIVSRGYKKLLLFVPLNEGGLAAGISAFIKSVAKANIAVIAVVRQDNTRLQFLFDHFENRNQKRNLIIDEHSDLKTDKVINQILKDNIKDIVAVSREETFAAIRDIYAENRVICEPFGAMSLSGLKKYVRDNDISTQNLMAICTDANLNFEALRYISTFADYGDNLEKLLVVESEKSNQLSLLLQRINKFAVTEINYYQDPTNFKVLIKVIGYQNENVATEIAKLGYKVTDFSNNDIAKMHLRFRFNSGKLAKDTELYHIHIPEVTSMMSKLVSAIALRHKIAFLHYANHGTEVSKVLIGVAVTQNNIKRLEDDLSKNCIHFKNVSANAAISHFI